MKKTTLIYLICLCFATINSSAQIDQTAIRPNKFKEFNISFFVGTSAFGLTDDMEHMLNKSNWNQTIPAGCVLFICRDAKDHPYTTKLAAFDFEATYFFAEQMAASLNIGLSDNIESTGYKPSIGPLHINSTVWSVSTNFVFRPRDKRYSFIVGPTLFSHAVSGEQISPHSKQLKLGVYLGWTINLIQKPNFSLPFKVVYRWASAYDIGPFDVNEGAAPSLQVVTINPSNLNIGIALTFRLIAQVFDSK